MKFAFQSPSFCKNDTNLVINQGKKKEAAMPLPTFIAASVYTPIMYKLFSIPRTSAEGKEWQEGPNSQFDGQTLLALRLGRGWGEKCAVTMIKMPACLTRCISLNPNSRFFTFENMFCGVCRNDVHL